MRYNPCGAIVDISRRPYRTQCRFLRDSDLESEVRWIEAAPDAAVYDGVSVILSKDLEPDRWMPGGVGERDDSPRRFITQKVPKGLRGAHTCGTAQDFEEGGEYAPDLPPVRYGTGGFPLCCRPAPVGRGGASASGRAVWSVVGPATPCPVPTDTCAAAPAGALDTFCVFTVFALETKWRRWAVTPGNYRLLAFIGAPSGVNEYKIWEGSHCASKTLLLYINFSTTIIAFDITVSSNSNVWLEVIDPTTTHGPQITTQLMTLP